MQSTVLLSMISSVLSAVILDDIDTYIDGITVNGTHHDIEHLKEDLDRPYQLCIDDETGDIYFSYSIGNTEYKEIYQSAKLNIYTKEFEVIKGINEGFAAAVNPKTFEVYIGASDGIYKYDKVTKEAKIIGAKGLDIWELYFNKILYFTTLHSLYTYNKDGSVTPMKDLTHTKVNHFVIDPENMIFFTNDTGLYTQKLGTKSTSLFIEFPEVGARALAIDRNGLAHICLQDGVYSINKPKRALKKLVHINDAFGLTFDSQNNIIYANVDGIIMLKKNTTEINDVE